MIRITFIAFLFVTTQLRAQSLVDFEDKSLPPDSFEKGSSLSGGFFSRGAFFNNSYNSTFDSWLGWSYSNMRDVLTPGFVNEFSAYHLPNGGGDASTLYGVAFNFSAGDARITLPGGSNPLSVRITNTTYTALSMRDGDGFAKQFGGPTGNDPDFFLLTVQGRDNSNAITGTVPFYLADYRFSTNAQDYLISQWTTLDLSALPFTTTSLTFELSSSDTGDFGMNTPAYFAVDNLLLAVPEPRSLALVAVSLAAVSWYWRRRNWKTSCKSVSSSRFTAIT